MEKGLKGVDEVKKWIILCLCSLFVLSAIMYMTKPSQDDYTAWLLENMSDRMEGKELKFIGVFHTFIPLSLDGE